MAVTDNFDSRIVFVFDDIIQPEEKIQKPVKDDLLKGY